MNDIQIFSNPLFGDVRTAGVKEEPLFCATDVARALGYSNPAKAVIDHCKGVTVLETPTKGGVQPIKFIKEPEVYRLIFKSTAPNAEQFNSWLAEDVIPTIRKTGGYISFNQNMTDEEIMARAIMVAQATIQKREQEIKLLSEQKQQETIRANAAEAQIEEQMPKVVFADAIVGSRSSCLIGELAKIITQNGYSIGQNRLFAWMRENGYLGTKGEYYNIPNQRYIDQKIFEVKKTTHSENGIMKTTTTPKVTGKGQLYFINKFVGVNKILL